MLGRGVRLPSGQRRMASEAGVDTDAATASAHDTPEGHVLSSVRSVVRIQALVRGYIERARANHACVRDGNIEEHVLEQAAVLAVQRADRAGGGAGGSASGPSAGVCSATVRVCVRGQGA